MSLYYYDSYWRIWVRRLLRTSRYVIDLSMTEINDDWEKVKEERIRIHGSSDQGNEFIDELPVSIQKEMVKNIGPELTKSLLMGNYIKAVGLGRLLAADRDHKGGGGIPFSEAIKR